MKDNCYNLINLKDQGSLIHINVSGMFDFILEPKK